MWSHDGMICTGETYKSVVKLTFAKGASLKDPASLFNSSLEGKRGGPSTSARAKDRREGVQGARPRRRCPEQVRGQSVTSVRAAPKPACTFVAHDGHVNSRREIRRAFAENAGLF